MDQPPICPGRLEKLLVCTDCSEVSLGAINGALALAGCCGSKIYFFSVLEFYPELEVRAPEIVAKREIEVRNHLEACRTRAEILGLAVETIVRRSESTYAAIIEEAEKLIPDMIIMGRHGRSRLLRLIKGNVTARVVGYSPFKVLILPREVPLKFKKILIASDGSPYSDAAWEEAVYIAKRIGSELLAISVAPGEDQLETAHAIVRKLQREAALQNLAIQTRVYQGPPSLAIIKAAKEKEVDLIVIGVLGMTGLTSILMGSVTERVIARAPCAVMVVKRPG